MLQLAHTQCICNSLRVKQTLVTAALMGFVLGCASPAALTVKNPASEPAPTRMPEIAGLDHRGTEFSLESALAKGPVVVIFYRGHW